MRREANKDCFAYAKKYGREDCKALNDLYCRVGEGRCAFYKKAVQVEGNEPEKGYTEYGTSGKTFK